MSTRARRDLTEIWTYIARHDPATASDFCEELVEDAASLRRFSYRGQSFLRRPGKRKLVHGSYLIVYEVDEVMRSVVILRFWHSARDQERMRLREDAAAYSVTVPSPRPIVATR
jgi:plasmid stabilization system protein ParE